MDAQEMPKDEWYSKTREFWQFSESTIKGVLGGIDSVHATDVKTSCELLQGLIQTQKIKPIQVLDCGAGIGRVTSDVLLNYFEECDIVEQDEKFVQNCKIRFEKNPKVKDIYQSPMQCFVFTKKYDVIWIQWCLENLDDEDLLKFLVNCKNNLNDGGMIIIKENIVFKGSTFVENDFSKVRSDVIFRDLFQKASLKMIKHFHQPNWPKDLLKVSVFVLNLG